MAYFKLLSRAAMSAERGGEAKATSYNKVKKGLLPPPQHIGAKSVWPEHEIVAINQAIISGKSDSEIRALVQDLVAARATVAGKSDDEIRALVKELIAACATKAGTEKHTRTRRTAGRYKRTIGAELA